MPRQLLLYALLTALTAISIDGLLPALRAIGRDVAASPLFSIQHVIALFIFGMAIGEVAIGPLCDALGRKKALYLGLAVYMAGTVIAMLAGSLEVVILGRILQGVGAAGPKIATRAMIRDQFEGDAMARVMSLMFTLFILVPMVAPTLGQSLSALAGWRAVFAFYLATAALLGLWLALRQPETLPADRRIPLRPRLIVLNAGRILSNRRVALLILATGLTFGSQLVYLGTAASLFFDAYGVAESFPLYFAAFATAIGLANFLNARLVQRFGMKAMARSGFVGLTLAGLVMLLVLAAHGGQLPFGVLALLVWLAFFAMGLVFGNLNALAMQSLAEVAGLGASLIASGSSLTATLFALAMGGLYNGTALSLSASFFLAGGSALILSELAQRGEAAPVLAVR